MFVCLFFFVRLFYLCRFVFPSAFRYLDIGVVIVYLFVCLLMVGCYIWRITWVSFKRNCGAASVGECNKIIWLYFFFTLLLGTPTNTIVIDVFLMMT